MAKKVYVGMSGGVDSSVTAALLKQAGYDVTGVYMKNWSQDLPGHHCPWLEDYQDAKRVATELNIPFKMYDFQKEYRTRVVDYMVNEYKAGRTPNPDIMCNQEIKFDLFLKAAIANGADLIATGHYARIIDGKLYAGLDEDKDQSYFLYRMPREALSKTLMPIGEYTKPEVRKLAAKFKLATAQKKDSQGICFVGKIGIKDFLLHELGEQASGPIIDQNGREIGQHDGALFYTIGQRHGLGTGGGLPYYVVDKDMSKNIVYVSTDLRDERMWRKTLQLTDAHWLDELPASLKGYKVRSRYRAPLVQIKTANGLDSNKLTVELSDEIRAITAGQSSVIYHNGQVLGGGIIS